MFCSIETKNMAELKMRDRGEMKERRASSDQERIDGIIGNV